MKHHDPAFSHVSARRPGRLATWCTAAALVLGFAGWASPSAAQSLGEAAKQEEARRKTIKQPAKVYTNGSLRTVPGEVIPTPPPPKPADAQPGAEPAAQPPGAAETPAAAEPPAQQDPRGTPEYWRQRMRAAIQARDSNQVTMDALQSQINALLTDFTNRDDPAERAVIAINRQKALDELARRQKEKIALEKAIEDIQEEARRARIPPGWLR